MLTLFARNIVEHTTVVFSSPLIFSSSRLRIPLHFCASGAHSSDIGANLGWFSLAAAAAGHRVIAIDALHTNVELLMRSIHDNPAFAPLIEARATTRAMISTKD
jgi:2-polyprenyl-3-methyl-5-hydroxy-6-metoxy-1,4-benzoquinol methylase